VKEHLDTDHLWRLINAGVPSGLPTLPAGLAIGRELA
jgi:hypothetical protein